MNANTHTFIPLAFLIDSCKFLHDRSDYKHGWQIERELDEGRYGVNGMSNPFASGSFNGRQKLLLKLNERVGMWYSDILFIVKSYSR